MTLEKAATTTVTVLSPDGRPAVGASVGLVSPGAWLSLKAGGLAQQPNQSPGTLLSTDAEGRFRLPPDDAISRVVVANPQGFADAAPVALCANPTLQLQPWGRVEGTYLSGGQPAPGRIVLLQYGSDDLSTLSSDVTAQTDAQGQFIIPQAPPGSHKLARVVVERLSPTSTSSQKFPLTEVEIRPGETTFLTLGASNCTVTVHLLWPEELKRQPNWRVFASLHTSFPQPPAEIANDPQALARWRQTPEFQAVAAQARHYPLTENAAGVWSTEDVAPGNYALTVNVLDLPPDGGQGSNRAHAHATVTVPANPSSLALDLGEIALQGTQ